jgi:adenine-specific DNA methylase
VGESGKGKDYRLPTQAEKDACRRASNHAATLSSKRLSTGLTRFPDELLATDEPRRMNVVLFGIRTWSELFNDRQLVALDSFRENTIEAGKELAKSCEDEPYREAVAAFLACAFDRLVDKCSTLCLWHNLGEKLEHTFGRQALPMVWDYAEVNPFSDATGNWISHLDWVARCIRANSFPSLSAEVKRGNAAQLPYESGSIDTIITDPPYYDSVCYANLSDFFYVWLKRTLTGRLRALFATPTTPKGPEIIQNLRHKGANQKKDKTFYEAAMREAFSETARVSSPEGVVLVMFAHKSTAAWEAMISSLIQAGLFPTASWPIHTEMAAGMVKKSKAMLASSISILCRRRHTEAPAGLWDEVREELHARANERLAFFWSQGIRGADFFISAIGPALSVFGRYARVTRLSGEEVTVGQFLDEVRGLVTNYALGKILQAKHTGAIDPETRFYVVWKWSYGNGKAAGR